MFSIEQSHFLQALGHAIGNSLWQMAALWLVYAGISNMGKWSANRKYQLAAGASLAGFAWFVVTLLYAYATWQVKPTLNGIYTETATGPASSFPDYILYLYHSTYASAQSLAPYISCAYLFMFIILGIRLSNGFKQVNFFATQGLEKSSVQWRLFVQQHAAALGIGRKVQLYTSQHVQSPLTLGFWKPIILMPVASLSQLTPAQVESILLHELAHIRRHDYLVNIFLQIAEISLFFNPFMRLLLNQVKQERENSCDDYVLQFQYCPKDYAKALLAIEHSNHTTLLALAAKGNQSFQLLNRVKRMVAPQPKAFNYRQQLGLLLLFTILMLGFTVIVPRPKQATHPANTIVVKKIIAENKPVAPAVYNTEVAIATEPPQPVYDIIKNITGHPDMATQMIDEKALAAMTTEIEKHTAEIEALGKEVEEKVKPVTEEIATWANGIANAPETALTGEYLKTWENLESLKTLPVAKLTEIGEAYQKKIMGKLNRLLKTLPFVNSTNANNHSVFAFDWQDNNNKQMVNEVKENLFAASQLNDVRQQAANRNIAFAEAQNKANRELQQAIKAEIASHKFLQQQIDAKQLEAMAKTDRLNLGLLTDDRDTCKAEGDGLLAKLQPHKPKPFNMHFKATAAFTVPPEVRINSKHPGKCVITVTENDIKIAPENEDDDPAFFKLNGQTIDVRQEKQMNNGKEEKVVVIRIGSSK